MNIRKNLVPSSKYSVKCPHTMTPTRIVVHNTANDASAENEISYMIRNNNQVSFHYAVDDKEVVQGIEENRNAWHAGDGAKGKGNREGIAIEICYSKSGGDRFIKAEQNAVELIVDILRRYGWGIDKVTKHQDYMNKYCPHRTLDMGWDRFINMIKEKLGQVPNVNIEKPQETQKNSFLPSRGYFKRGDVSENVGKIASFMYKNFPAYTNKKALGNIYGPYIISSIKEFQRRTNLTPDGCTGSLTLAKLKEYGFRY